MIHETQIFIEKPIRDVVRDAHFDQKPIVVREGNEIAFLFGGMHPDEAVFGLSADMDAPQGPFWTQLLHKHPKDLVALARVLTTLNIKRDQITPATDWDGEPLFDVDALKREMLVVVENPSAARTSKSTVGTRRPQKVPIATFRGKAIGGFASVRAAAKPAAKKVVAKPAAKKAAAKPAAKKVAAKPAAKKVAAQKAAATKLAATKTRQA